MNNNEILTRLHNDSQYCQPSDSLSPNAIEDALSGVKRRNNKALVGTCVTLGVACITCIGIFSSMFSNNTATTGSFIENNLYSDIYDKVNKIKKNSDNHYLNTPIWGFTGTQNSANDIITESTTTGVTNKSDYSNTNIQVEGVDEADIIKTDGKYIYSVSNNIISIALANNGNPKFVSEIFPDTRPTDIYIYEDTLVVISDFYNMDNDKSSKDKAEYNYYFNSSDTAVYVFDISDKSNPVEKSTLSQSGRYISSRRIDNVLYLISNYTVYDYENIDKNKPETYCPLYGVNDKTKCVDANSIIIYDDTNTINYITISSVDLSNCNEFADICSVLGAGKNVYASQKNIYTSAYSSSKDRNQTSFMRFSLDGTKIKRNGTFKVDGSILNQFSMDEHNGYFRVVTETTKHITTENYSIVDDSTKLTALYVFDKDLKLCGKTENVAKGESVKSVRFDGDIAYFVTFRQTDPLFTVDLSNPNAPKILSELKIPGFSEYLHIYGKNLLLGFGREADIISGGEEGLKITMFDVSDKTNVTELATKIFTSSEVFSPAETNHKAIFVDIKNNVIGIPYKAYTDDGEKSYYSIFKYDTDKNEFIQVNNLNLYNYDYTDFSDEYYSRGLYIGDYFYIVTQDTIYAYNYDNFEHTSTLEIPTK